MSRPPRDIHQAIADRCDKDRDFAVATVLKAAGSTPCKAGAKAIIDAGGVILGTIGGGAVEAHSQQLAVKAIKIGRPLVFDFNLEGNAVESSDPICGGMMRVLIDPAAARRHAAYAAASRARQCRQRGVLLTVIRGEKTPEGKNAPDIDVLFFAETEIPADFAFPNADALRSVLAREETVLFVSQSSPEGQRIEVLVEPLVANPLLVIAGGGHVSQALALQADLVGFDILVLDDRVEFTAASLFPEGATTRCCPVDEEIGRLAIGGDTYIVIVTRGHQHDAEALAACLKKPAAYIGMIGSRRKVEMMRKEFVYTGRATPAEFDRVYAPIGLDIGSVTVPEIAASIAAQLIAVRRKGAAPKIQTK
ncbi:MAG: XdhC family protein [Thermoguttaceae bacterium]|jgi:xanthine dehydrogenase accessory factor